ncbi:DUF2017 family protein [Leifsonia sp. ZF2019]|uniref:DUF2017 family protein n=1 Tax=Leifsonia sp. ZF2019 TaxID=2781978 RepID=UPI001CC1451B|nr:DUF2017 family protein [Leifsonia sp. ZF2019]UAJ81008.1 DUF2017 family protein [Leifsonia sp. ZF2019]
MRLFRPAGHGSVTARFEPEEAELLLRLAADAAELASEAAAVDDDLRADPALIRLMPDAYPGDAKASAEFRRFTADGIAERKALNARIVVECLARSDASRVDVTLDEAQATAWLRCLTDIRLVLAARLGIVQDGDEGDQHDEESQIRRTVFDWLAVVQESLVLSLGRG